MSEKPEKQLWLNDARGVYIPRDFAKSFDDRKVRVRGVSDEDWAILDEGPDALENPYWETWDDVLNNAVIKDDNGVEFTLYQDGDLWLIPKGMEWSDTEDGFVWPETEVE